MAIANAIVPTLLIQNSRLIQNDTNKLMNDSTIEINQKIDDLFAKKEIQTDFTTNVCGYEIVGDSIYAEFVKEPYTMVYMNTTPVYSYSDPEFNEKYIANRYYIPVNQLQSPGSNWISFSRQDGSGQTQVKEITGVTDDNYYQLIDNIKSGNTAHYFQFPTEEPTAEVLSIETIDLEGQKELILEFAKPSFTEVVVNGQIYSSEEEYEGSKYQIMFQDFLDAAKMRNELTVEIERKGDLEIICVEKQAPFNQVLESALRYCGVSMNTETYQYESWHDDRLYEIFSNSKGYAGQRLEDILGISPIQNPLSYVIKDLQANNIEKSREPLTLATGQVSIANNAMIDETEVPIDLSNRWDVFGPSNNAVITPNSIKVSGGWDDAIGVPIIINKDVSKFKYIKMEVDIKGLFSKIDLAWGNNDSALKVEIENNGILYPLSEVIGTTFSTSDDAENPFYIVPTTGTIYFRIPDGITYIEQLNLVLGMAKNADVSIKNLSFVNEIGTPAEVAKDLDKLDFSYNFSVDRDSNEGIDSKTFSLINQSHDPIFDNNKFVLVNSYTIDHEGTFTDQYFTNMASIKGTYDKQKYYDNYVFFKTWNHNDFYLNSSISFNQPNKVESKTYSEKIMSTDESYYPPYNMVINYEKILYINFSIQDLETQGKALNIQLLKKGDSFYIYPGYHEEGSAEFDESINKLADYLSYVYSRNNSSEVGQMMDYLVAKDYDGLLNSKLKCSGQVFANTDLENQIRTLMAVDSNTLLPLDNTTVSGYITAVITKFSSVPVTTTTALEIYSKLQNMYQPFIPTDEIGMFGQKSMLCLYKLAEYVEKGIIEPISISSAGEISIDSLPQQIGLLPSTTAVSMPDSQHINLKYKVGGKTITYNIILDPAGTVSSIKTSGETEKDGYFGNMNLDTTNRTLSATDIEYMSARIYQSLINSGDPILQELLVMENGQLKINNMNAVNKIKGSGSFRSIDSEVMFFNRLDTTGPVHPVLISIEDGKGTQPLACRIKFNTNSDLTLNLDSGTIQVKNYISDADLAKDSWQDMSWNMISTTNVSKDPNGGVSTSGFFEDVLNFAIQWAIQAVGGWVLNALNEAVKGIELVQQAMAAVEWANNIKNTAESFIAPFKSAADIVETLNNPQKLLEGLIPKEIIDIRKEIENNIITITQTIAPIVKAGQTIEEQLQKTKEEIEERAKVYIKIGETTITDIDKEIARIEAVINSETQQIETRLIIDQAKLEAYVKANMPDIKLDQIKIDILYPSSVNGDGSFNFPDASAIDPNITIDLPELDFGIELPEHILKSSIAQGSVVNLEFDGNFGDKGYELYLLGPSGNQIFIGYIKTDQLDFNIDVHDYFPNIQNGDELKFIYGIPGNTVSVKEISVKVEECNDYSYETFLRAINETDDKPILTKEDFYNIIEGEDKTTLATQLFASLKTSGFIDSTGQVTSLIITNYVDLQTVLSNNGFGFGKKAPQPIIQKLQEAYANPSSEKKKQYCGLIDIAKQIMDFITNSQDNTAATLAEICGSIISNPLGNMLDIKDLMVEGYKKLKGQAVNKLVVAFSVIGLAVPFIPVFGRIFDGVVNKAKNTAKLIDPSILKKVEDGVELIIKSKQYHLALILFQVIEDNLNRIKKLSGAVKDAEIKRLNELLDALFHKFDNLVPGSVLKQIDDIIKANTVYKKIDNFYVALRKHPDDLLPEEIAEIKRIRNTFILKDGDDMVKLFPHAVDGTQDLSGYILRKSDLLNCNTTEEVFDLLRLDYPGTQFVRGGQDFHVVEYKFKSTDCAMEIPFTKEYGGNINIKDTKYPFSGNGFLTSKGTIIPEWNIPKDTPLSSSKYSPSVTFSNWRAIN